MSFQKKLIVYFFIIFFIINLQFLMANAQTNDGIKLEFKPISGGELYYILKVDVNTLFTLYGLEKKILQQVTTDFVIRNTKNTTNDNCEFEIEILDEKIQSDNKEVPSNVSGSKIILKLSKNGKIISSSDPTKLQYFQDLIISFPENKIKVGDEWKLEIPFKLPDENNQEKEYKALLTCKLAEIKKMENKNCAIIDMNLNIIDDKLKSKTMVVNANGKLYFDYENGNIISANNTLNMDLKIIDTKNSTADNKIEASTLKGQIKINLNKK